MNNREDSVLVAGFNTRPLAFSLSQAGYDVYAVDFFGDLDLYPWVKDSLILTKKLKSTYSMDHTPDTPQDVFSRETLIGLADGLMDWLFSGLRFDILIHKKSKQNS